MKNILILAVFLFAAFSFVGCSDDGPVDSITGPTPIAGPQGEPGPKGEPGPDGADGSGDTIPAGHHSDMGPRDIFYGCLEDYHIHGDSVDNVCRTEVGGFDIGGYDINGWDVEGYGIDGLDSDGWDVDGYDADGLDSYGCTRTQTWTPLPVGDGFCWDNT